MSRPINCWFIWICCRSPSQTFYFITLTMTIHFNIFIPFLLKPTKAIQITPITKYGMLTLVCWQLEKTKVLNRLNDRGRFVSHFQTLFEIGTKWIDRTVKEYEKWKKKIKNRKMKICPKIVPQGLATFSFRILAIMPQLTPIMTVNHIYLVNFQKSRPTINIQYFILSNEIWTQQVLRCCQLKFSISLSCCKCFILFLHFNRTFCNHCESKSCENWNERCDWRQFIVELLNKWQTNKHTNKKSTKH